MEPFKKRDRFLSCNVLNQLGNHPADATIVDHINTAAEEDAPADLSGSHPVDAEEDAPADLLGSHPDTNTDDRENAPNDKDAPADLAIRRSGDAFNQTNVPITEGDANRGTFVAVIGDGNEPDVAKLIEHPGGGGSASDVVSDGEKQDETLVIENAGGDGSASDALEIVDGKKLEVGDVACNVGGTQTDGNQQATFQVLHGNVTEVAPGGGTSPIDDNIRNEQTHTKRKSQEPGDFSQDAEDSGHHAPRPKRTKIGDAGRDGIGTGNSINIPFVAGNCRFVRLFGTNIPLHQEEHELPVTNQPLRRLRLFGVDIFAPQDSAAADTRNESSVGSGP